MTLFMRPGAALDLSSVSVRYQVYKGNGYISNIDRVHNGIVNYNSDSTVIISFTIPVPINLKYEVMYLNFCMQFTKHTFMPHLKKFLNLSRALTSTGI